MLGILFLILVVGFICFQIGTLFPRTRSGSKYYVQPFDTDVLADVRIEDTQPRWSTTRRWYSNTDHKQWQKQFDALSSK